MRAARHKTGSVRFDKRRGTWNYLWYEKGGGRRSKLIGTKRDFPTKAAAWEAAAPLRPQPTTIKNDQTVPRVNDVIERYRQEQMPIRFSTRISYECWLKNHIIPRWGESPLTDVQPRVVELWLTSLKLSPKSRAHIRGLLRKLWDYSMWAGLVPIERNPMELVTVRGNTKRMLHPRSLTIAEFQRFLAELGTLNGIVRVIAVMCACFGLRISECLALRWSDVNWLQNRLRVERGIVRQRVDDVKTVYSERLMPIDTGVLALLKDWKQTTQFPENGDWIFASPVKLGRLPVSYPHVWQTFQQAADRAEITRFGTHTLRHSYRSWLDACGTTPAVRQKLMRHTDIRTTMNYGDVVTNQESEALTKIAQLALKQSAGRAQA